MTSKGKLQEETKNSPGAVVYPIKFAGDDRALWEALCSQHQGAAATLYDRYSQYIQSYLVRLMGFDSEVGDLLQEVFLQALKSVEKLRDPDRMKAWLGSIAVHTARACIRRRTRWRWIQYREPESLPLTAAPTADDETREVLKMTYEILDRMPVEERIAFSLRFIEGLELTETANACNVSLATIKRRLSKAEKRFLSLAQTREPVLAWIERGSRWRNR